ncbi:MAG TPA: type II toxin-antitoxin system VapC family toxin [Terracidiphilus sp.]|nr:type II toxin-antitoxin system VapC family toxin [Terracidiphilus sp.]
MIFLLDTHTFLWFLREPGQLPGRVSDILYDPSSTLALSLVTPWEIAIKAGTGKLEADDILDGFEMIATTGRMDILDTTARQVIRSGLLPLHHRDPFDRLLAAQSVDLDLTILSGDRVFDLYGVKRIWE